MFRSHRAGMSEPLLCKRQSLFLCDAMLMPHSSYLPSPDDRRFPCPGVERGQTATLVGEVLNIPQRTAMNLDAWSWPAGTRAARCNTSVFLILIISPKALEAVEKQSARRCKTSSEWAASTQSSGKRKSRTSASALLVLAFR